MKLSVSYSSSLVLVLICINVVFSEPPVRNSGGWGSGGQQQQQQQYSAPAVPAGGYGPPTGSYNNGAQSGGSGWNQPQQQQQQVRTNGGGWNQQQQQPQVQSGGGWGMQAQTQQANSGGGWGSGNDQAQKQTDQGSSGWGSQINVELDSANIQKFNPRDFFKSIIGIPRKIFNFIRESGLYILLIPLIIILPLMLLAFNAGRLLGGLGGWGWGRSLTSTVESGIVGYLKSPAWQKVAETLMDEHVFDRVMKSLEEFNPKPKTEDKKKSKQNW